MKRGWGRLVREEKLILALLNEKYDEAEALLKGKTPLLWNLIFNLTASHRIIPPVMGRLIERFQPLLDEEIVKQARLFILQQKTVNKLHREELIAAGALLADAGFDVTLMKGLSYDPSEKIGRTYGDVDLLVEEEKIQDIFDFLTDRGYRYKGSFILSREEKKSIQGQLSWNNQYQFTCPRSPQTIEVHTNLFERDRIRLENLTALLDRPDLFKRDRTWQDDLKCYLPSPEAALMLLCLHCSLKRSLYNNRFILRHMSDMDMLFARGIKGEVFLQLCEESETSYHAAFSLALYRIIREKGLPSWYDTLNERLTRRERNLLNKHLNCLKNLRSSSAIGRLVYNFTAPFIIGGNRKQRYTWIRNNLFATKVEQENRYYRWGFKKESPLIYLTYLINPFQTTWRFIKKILGIRDNSEPES
ncbi:MAG: nucleotidyltransferase family protein [Spirochaetales bacterium]|nr:nucleotidyltransferase family protein [Spirochaetales bacterium]